MTAAAAAQLSRILESGLESADIAEAVTDAAVVLLLALRRQGISNPKRIPPCTVIWHGQENREHVLLGHDGYLHGQGTPVSAPDYGRSLRGIGFNLLVTDVPRAVRFVTEVLGATSTYDNDSLPHSDLTAAASSCSTPITPTAAIRCLAWWQASKPGGGR